MDLRDKIKRETNLFCVKKNIWGLEKSRFPGIFIVLETLFPIQKMGDMYDWKMIAATVVFRYEMCKLYKNLRIIYYMIYKLHNKCDRIRTKIKNVCK